MMMPDRCHGQADGQMWQECGRPRHEIGNQPPIDRPNDLSRAPNAAPGNPPLGQDPPGVFLICTRGGGGGVEQDQLEHARVLKTALPQLAFLQRSRQTMALLMPCAAGYHHLGSPRSSLAKPRSQGVVWVDLWVQQQKQ